MGEFFSHAPALLTAIVVGYIIGAMPLAVRVSRRRGIDIFAVGTRLAGASNVLKRVGKVPAFLVLIGDLAKGVLAVVVGRLLGLEGSWVLLPATAAVLGHWNSVFTGFRGGDGLATLGGVIIGLFPLAGVVSVAVAGVISLGGQRIPYTSLLSVVFGYSTLATLNVINQDQLALTFGLGGVSAIVLAHAISGHVKRRRDGDWDGLGDPGIAESTGA